MSQTDGPIIEQHANKNNSKAVANKTNKSSVIKVDDNAKSLSTDYTKVSFEPDLLKFGLNVSTMTTPSLQSALYGTMKIIERRAMDIAACVPAGVRVHYNSKLLDIDSFKSYADLFTTVVSVLILT